MPQIKSCKKLAKQYLGQNGNWAKMALAGVGLVFVCFLPLMLVNDGLTLLFGASDVSEQLYSVLFWSAFLIWSLVITVPGVALFYRYAWYLYIRTRDGFSVSGNRKQDPVQTWLFGLFTLLRPVAVVLLFMAAYGLASLSQFWLWLPLAALAVFLSFLLMKGTGGLFFLPYRFCQGRSAPEAWRKSVRDMRGNYRQYAAYMRSFLGWILLSLLTAGVLLAVYLLPLMMFTYFALGDQCAAGQIREE